MTEDFPREVAEIKQVLRSFFAAMNGWEIECKRRTRETRNATLSIEDGRSIADAELRSIFEEFCTIAEPKRGLQFQSPPEYDPHAEHILDVEVQSATRAIVTTQQSTGFGKKCIYRLLRTDRGWRVDQRALIGNDGRAVRIEI